MLFGYHQGSDFFGGFFTSHFSHGKYKDLSDRETRRQERRQRSVRDCCELTPIHPMGRVLRCINRYRVQEGRKKGTRIFCVVWVFFEEQPLDFSKFFTHLFSPHDPTLTAPVRKKVVKRKVRRTVVRKEVRKKRKPKASIWEDSDEDGSHDPVRAIDYVWIVTNELRILFWICLPPPTSPTPTTPPPIYVFVVFSVFLQDARSTRGVIAAPLGCLAQFGYTYLHSIKG